MIAEKKKTVKKWTSFHHQIVRYVLYPLIVFLIWLMYGFKVTKFKEENDRQYLVLANHQTGFDQFYPSAAFRRPIYYLASEDIFSMGFLSKIIIWLQNPIPIKKQVTDIRAVKTCMKVAKEGGNIGIFPEGNRTFSGETAYINPAIGGLAKKLGLPIAFFKIEGGYGVQPRWSDVRRRGKMRAYVSKVLEPEEYKDLTNEQLYQRICQELYQNETAFVSEYFHKRSAEYVERVLYVCPHCGVTHFESHGNKVTCTSCGRSATYLPNKKFEGDFPFADVLAWYRYQQDYVNGLDLLSMTDAPIIRDVCNLYSVELYQGKTLMGEGVKMALYGDRLEMTGSVEMCFRFNEMETITILGKNKLNIYHKDMVYQIQSDKRFNALKYINLFHRYKNITSEGKNGNFLGM